MGGIGATQRFRIAKIVPIFKRSNINKMGPLGHIENLQPSSASDGVSQIEPKLGGRHWGDMEVQNC